ncbi:alpha-galactosidase [Desemzia sp. RIT804]|uniref:alpha-galactosidase n=1 Tax=Desemzia sp. RIT 804 TaxID=2810209 RepID=UPI00194F555C|nr:alpha-galactosidase [Desemzia sp. RIT 804]MBM6614496.1 alpha-galactosidase [Desemzia sp. RIT 804]
MIQVNEVTKEFHLSNKKVSYIFRVDKKTKQLEQLYFGKHIKHRESFFYLVERENRPANNLYEGDHTSSLEHIKQEYPSFGTTDFRYPAYQIKWEAGDRVTHLEYSSYNITKGKPILEGLPATYVENETEAETLTVILKDAYSDLEVQLNYTIFTDFPVITRSTRFSNHGSEVIELENAMSTSIDLPDANFELVHLNGAWARETHVERKELHTGLQSISSARGASSHAHNPFMALVRPTSTETNGEVYGFSLVYSGNFTAQIEVDTYHVTRAMIGINPFQFSWKLTNGKSFQTPEAVMVYSDEGLNGMSQAFHELYRTRLARGTWRDEERPVLINNWEATYFDFNEEKILEIAENAAELGVELFVLDDGWFNKRNDDTSSLGDWVEDKTKLPNGVKGLSEKIHQLGLKFGLWFEPEMVNKDTKLYEHHPDWIIQVPGKNVSHGRNQFVLDFSRPEVVDNLYHQMDAIIDGSQIDYIKWDMNRYISEAFSIALPSDRQGEVYHRYILGVYDLYERLIAKYPNILFESCAGGGARNDPGMLFYAPQAWASDDTDAVERLKIQYGTSMVYPLSSIGSHVSAVPNHQVGRMTSMDMRSHVAYFGTFGYELDITALSQMDKEAIQKHIQFFKKHRKLVQQGDFYRLKSPFEGNHTAWIVVSKDQTEALVGFYQILGTPNPAYERLQLTGLDTEKMYKVHPMEQARYGDDLMAAGLIFADDVTTESETKWKFNRHGDFTSNIFYLTSKNDSEVEQWG